MPAAIRLTVLMCVFLAVLSEDTSTSTTPVAASILTTLTTAGSHDTSKVSATAGVTSVETKASSQSVTSSSAASSPPKSSSSSPTPGHSPPVHTTHTQLTPNDTVGTTTNTSTVTHSPPLTHRPNWTSTTQASTAGVQPAVFNAGLITVLCIFCIVLALGLVVCIIKTVRSRRNSFERLEDVPMDKVSEESPITHYSK